jgi:hypothetical protein
VPRLQHLIHVHYTLISFYRGHLPVFWSSLISIAILVLAPLSSETFFVSLSGSCGPDEPPCRASWGIYPLLARILEGILAFIAVLIGFLILFGLRRKPSVCAEPLSIAGLATLFCNSPLLQEFREIDSMVSNSELKNILAGKRYSISAFSSLDQRPCYGVHLVDADYGTEFMSKALARKGKYSLEGPNESLGDSLGIPLKKEKAKEKPGAWANIKEKLLYVAALLMLAGLLALVTYYHWTSGNTGFERFMDSQGFGVRFMMSALGLVVKLFWSNIDQGKTISLFHKCQTLI